MSAKISARILVAEGSTHSFSEVILEAPTTTQQTPTHSSPHILHNAFVSAYSLRARLPQRR